MLNTTKKRETKRKEIAFYLDDDKQKELYDFMMSQSSAKQAVIDGLQLLKNKNN